MSLVESLKEIASHGIRYVDICGKWHGDPTLLTPQEKKEVARVLIDLGLTSSNLLMLTPGNIAAEDPEERRRCLDYVERCLEFAAMLGGKQVLYDAGDKIIGIPNHRAWQNSVDFSRRVGDLAATYGIMLTMEIEPCAYAMMIDIDQMVVYLADVNRANVLANLDIGHLAISRDSAADLRKVIDKAIHVHISDNDGLTHSNDIIGTGAALIGEYLNACIDFGIDETARRYGVEPVAALELGLYGMQVEDRHHWVRASMDHVFRVAPRITL